MILLAIMIIAIASMVIATMIMLAMVILAIAAMAIVARMMMTRIILAMEVIDENMYIILSRSWQRRIIAGPPALPLIIVFNGSFTVSGQFFLYIVNPYPDMSGYRIFPNVTFYCVRIRHKHNSNIYKMELGLFLRSV